MLAQRALGGVLGGRMTLRDGAGATGCPGLLVAQPSSPSASSAPGDRSEPWRGQPGWGQGLQQLQAPPGQAAEGAVHLGTAVNGSLSSSSSSARLSWRPGPGSAPRFWGPVKPNRLPLPSPSQLGGR